MFDITPLIEMMIEAYAKKNAVNISEATDRVMSSKLMSILATDEMYITYAVDDLLDVMEEMEKNNDR